MSVEAKDNGALRLRCDFEECERKFIPRRRLQDATQLRLRAALYGWAALGEFDIDRCPTHSKERTP